MLTIENVKNQLAKTNDNSYVNLETGRKIKWAESKEKRFIFHKASHICACITISKKLWNSYITALSSPPKQKHDPYDLFDWSEDMKMKNCHNKKGFLDYIKN
jgi:hypothetical protein